MLPFGLSMRYEYEDPDHDCHSPTIVIDFDRHPALVNDTQNVTVTQMTYDMCYHFMATLVVFLENARVLKIDCTEFTYEVATKIIDNPNP